jgi:hypothetical protein
MSLIQLLDTQINRYLSTHQPRNQCEWALAITEISSTFNDLMRLGYGETDIEAFIERSLSAAKLYGIPRAKLEKLQQLLVIPDDITSEEEDISDEDEDSEDDSDDTNCTASKCLSQRIPTAISSKLSKVSNLVSPTLSKVASSNFPDTARNSSAARTITSSKISSTPPIPGGRSLRR